MSGDGVDVATLAALAIAGAAGPSLLMLHVSDVMVESRSAMLVPKLVKLLFPAPYEAGSLACRVPCQPRVVAHQRRECTLPQLCVCRGTRRVRCGVFCACVCR